MAMALLPDMRDSPTESALWSCVFCLLTRLIGRTFHGAGRQLSVSNSLFP